MNHTAILCLGSNVPPRDERLSNAVEAIGRIAVLQLPRCRVESDDITGRGAPYVNISLRCTTDLGREEFEACLKDIERDMGRTAESRSKAVMPLDADIVVWDGVVVSPRDFNAPYFTMPGSDA